MGWEGKKNKLIDFLKVLSITFKINEGENKIEGLKGYWLSNRKVYCIWCHYFM